ncbi:hypothetical protein EDD21DRAFT_375947 [Dissophora ornata]|nr:hypothetical protein EDD21DRAFT_375947 [Dissophora ornata]
MQEHRRPWVRSARDQMAASDSHRRDHGEIDHGSAVGLARKNRLPNDRYDLLSYSVLGPRIPQCALHAVMMCCSFEHTVDMRAVRWWHERNINRVVETEGVVVGGKNTRVDDGYECCFASLEHIAVPGGDGSHLSGPVDGTVGLLCGDGVDTMTMMRRKTKRRSVQRRRRRKRKSVGGDAGCSFGRESALLMRRRRRMMMMDSSGHKDRQQAPWPLMRQQRWVSWFN